MRSAARILVAVFGDPRRYFRALREAPTYLWNLLRFRRTHSAAPPSLRLSWRRLNPQLLDRRGSAGATDDHYFRQDLWAARRIFDAAPVLHVDVGSRIDGFVAHLLTFREVVVMDVRSLKLADSRLTFVRGDVRRLPFASGTVRSISSLHALEHVGLGRYGDEVDPLGTHTAAEEIARVLAPDGLAYVGLPIGRERVEFDAHRVFDPRRVAAMFDPLTVEEFSVIDDCAEFHENAQLDDFVDAYFACGLFVFRRERE